MIAGGAFAIGRVVNRSPSACPLWDNIKRSQKAGYYCLLVVKVLRSARTSKPKHKPSQHGGTAKGRSFAAPTAVKMNYYGHQPPLEGGGGGENRGSDANEGGNYNLSHYASSRTQQQDYIASAGAAAGPSRNIYHGFHGVSAVYGLCSASGL